MCVLSKLLAFCVAPQSFSQDPLNELQELVDILQKSEVQKRNHSGDSVECMKVEINSTVCMPAMHNVNQSVYITLLSSGMGAMCILCSGNGGSCISGKMYIMCAMS